MLTQQFDAVVLGGGAAGLMCALEAGKRGRRVAVLERATFPRDTLSSHVFETDALTFLARLGVIGQLRATGAPLVGPLEERVALAG